MCRLRYKLEATNGASSTAFKPRHYTTLMEWVFTWEGNEYLVIWIFGVQRELVFTHRAISLQQWGFFF